MFFRSFRTACWGGTWSAVRVGEIIKNEKYAGNALLQKKYVKDHLTKTLVRNKGNLPQYYAEDTHPAIIDLDTFQKSQEILSRKRERYSGKNRKNKYPFTSKIVCGICGKKYGHKNIRGRDLWYCSTYLKYGKDSCPSKQIHEEILHKVTAEVLGLSEFDEELWKGTIEMVKVDSEKEIIFIFKDGMELSWNI